MQSQMVAKYVYAGRTGRRLTATRHCALLLCRAVAALLISVASVSTTPTLNLVSDTKKLIVMITEFL